jgi:hypothetical protein
MRLRRLVPLIALCSFVPSSASPEPGSDPGGEAYRGLTPVRAPARIIVRVYEVDVLGSELKATALNTAEKTLSGAAIAVGWRECPPAPQDAARGALSEGRRAGVSPACETPGVGEFVLRIVRSTARHHDEGLPLGDAFVDTETRSAVLATVYADRVARVAAAAGADTAVLLGYAIAHEIGHLLMASTHHSRSGLMRSVWRAAELRARRAGDWTFTAADVATMTGRLAPPGTH